MKTRKITEDDLNNFPIDIWIDGSEASIIDGTINGMYLLQTYKLEIFSKGCLLARAMIKENDIYEIEMAIVKNGEIVEKHITGLTNNEFKSKTIYYIDKGKKVSAYFNFITSVYDLTSNKENKNENN